MCGAEGGVGACPATLSDQKINTAGETYGGPGVAVDGLTPGPAAGTRLDYFHTPCDKSNEWWRVDFGVSRRVQRVEIRGRNDRNDLNARIDTAIVKIGDSETHSSNVACGNALSGNQFAHTVTCDLVGRYLHVVLPTTACFSFSELSAYGPCACAACVACPESGTSALGSIGVGACVFTCPSNAHKTADGLACECDEGSISEGSNCVSSQLVLRGRYFAGTADILADSSGANAPLQKWTPAENNRDSAGWNGVAVMKVPSVIGVTSADLVSFPSAVPPRLNTVNLLGTSTTAAFYKTSVNPLPATNTSNLGVLVVSVSFWIRPGAVAGHDRVIYSWVGFDGRPQRLKFIAGTYALAISRANIGLGTTAGLFSQDTWAHIVIQIGLDGRLYLHVNGVALFSRNLYPVAEYADLAAFQSATGYTSGVTVATYDYLVGARAGLLNKFTVSSFPVGSFSFGGCYDAGSVAGEYERCRTGFYFLGAMADMRIYTKPVLLTTAEIQQIYMLT